MTKGERELAAKRLDEAFAAIADCTRMGQVDDKIKEQQRLQGMVELLSLLGTYPEISADGTWVVNNL